MLGGCHAHLHPPANDGPRQLPGARHPALTPRNSLPPAPSPDPLGAPSDRTGNFRGEGQERGLTKSCRKRRRQNLPGKPGGGEGGGRGGGAGGGTAVTVSHLRYTVKSSFWKVSPGGPDPQLTAGVRGQRQQLSGAEALQVPGGAGGRAQPRGGALCCDGCAGGASLLAPLGGRPSVTATLTLALLRLLVQVHAPAPACRTPQALGLALGQLLSYCQEEVVDVHGRLGGGLHEQ